MTAVPEIIDRPLTPAALGARYRELCSDPLLSNVPGTIEIDTWGRILMSPASNYHGILQMRVGRRFDPLSGTSMVEASVLTTIGVLVADVAWGSDEFMRLHSNETPFTAAPEICVEIASPSNSTKELEDKVAAYLAAGALEAWVVFPQSKRIEFFTASGLQPRSNFEIDFAKLFD
jgi:Uma2 family endonuclease